MDALSVSENPFCTRRISPGAIPYIFPSGESAESLADRLRQAGWWGQITGPHGSGKSTLLAALTPAIQQAGQQTILMTLHDRERRLPLRLQSDVRFRPPAVLMVDGYEQLSHWSRLMLKRTCRRQGVGLLVTTHTSVGLPDIFRTVVTSDLAGQIVHLLLGDREPPFTPEEVSRCLSRHRGDLREALFELYDLFEKRRPLGKI